MINDHYHSLTIILLILNRIGILGLRFNGSEIFFKTSPVLKNGMVIGKKSISLVLGLK